MSKILITGSSGYIGSVQEIFKKWKKIYFLDKDNPKNWYI